ncbi:MAG: hypothetical protein A3F68_00545 [Acidobacteria bacterium RIFCSPLOWO2_12_FULL_54_10]|nr:MAG: hypothetical protein A3F68_00545 [Acidobacteria bacterium RIFCSPLOWO2_12_FULL_54_10]
MRIQCTPMWISGGRFLRVGLIALLLLLSAQAQEPDELLRTAAAALQKEDYPAAAKTLESYLALKPEDTRAEFNLALAYSFLQRKQEAIERYRNVLSREKELPQARLNLGLLLLETGQPAEAVELLQAIVQQQPANHNALYRLAQALALANRNNDAQTAYEQFLSLQPSHVQAHMEVAKLMSASDPAAAAAQYRRVLELDPAIAEARLLLAEILEAQSGQQPDGLQEASDLYRQYLDERPERTDVRITLAKLYARQKKYLEAIEQYEQAKAAGETGIDLAKDLLHAYLQVPEAKVKAQSLAEELLAQDGSDAELWLAAGRLRMEKQEYREAAQRFLRATQLKPDWPQGYTNLASALFLLKNYEGAITALARISEWQQDTAGTYFLRAISLDNLRQRKPALENYQRFLASDEGKNPDQEFQARQRVRIISLELQKGIK